MAGRCLCVRSTESDMMEMTEFRLLEVSAVSLRRDRSFLINRGNWDMLFALLLLFALKVLFNRQ